MPTSPPRSRDKFAEVSTFQGMSEKNRENQQLLSPISPDICIFPQNEKNKQVERDAGIEHNSKFK